MFWAKKNWPEEIDLGGGGGMVYQFAEIVCRERWEKMV